MVAGVPSIIGSFLSATSTTVSSSQIDMVLASELTTVGIFLTGMIWFVIGRRTGGRIFVYAGLATLSSVPFQWVVALYELIGLPHLYVLSYSVAVEFDSVMTNVVAIVNPLLLVFIPLCLWTAGGFFQERLFSWASAAAFGQFLVHFSPILQFAGMGVPLRQSADAILLSSYALLSAIAFGRLVNKRAMSPGLEGVYVGPNSGGPGRADGPLDIKTARNLP